MEKTKQYLESKTNGHGGLSLGQFEAEELIEISSIEFADWINRNGYEPLAIFPLKDNKKWSCDDGVTTKTTKQLYGEFTDEG